MFPFQLKLLRFIIVHTLGELFCSNARLLCAPSLAANTAFLPVISILLSHIRLTIADVELEFLVDFTLFVSHQCSREPTIASLSNASQLDLQKFLVELRK